MPQHQSNIQCLRPFNSCLTLSGGTYSIMEHYFGSIFESNAATSRRALAWSRRLFGACSAGETPRRLRRTFIFERGVGRSATEHCDFRSRVSTHMSLNRFFPISSDTDPPRSTSPHQAASVYLHPHANDYEPLGLRLGLCWYQRCDFGDRSR